MTWSVRGYDEHDRLFWEVNGFRSEDAARAEFGWRWGNMTGTVRIELIEVHAEFVRAEVAADRS
jgi:hypothetical protein